MFSYRVVAEMTERCLDSDEPEVKLLYGIIKQAVIDLACEHEPEVLESAAGFIRSPYCRGLCDSVGLNYLYLLQLIQQQMRFDMEETLAILNQGRLLLSLEREEQGFALGLGHD